MKKFLLSLVLIFFSISTLFAQRDTEHWIAPYFMSTSATGYTNTLYMSTDSTTPFDVKIYNNNTLLTTVTISKGNPQSYSVAAGLISTSTTSEASTVITKGLYLKGDKPFFCSLRSAQSAHGEIVTSKGKAGIGTKFYAAAAPITYNSASLMNFTTGIMATEDATTVTVSGYNPNVQFVNNTPAPLSVTFTLNKGQSYILAGLGDNTPNFTGFIGAKITSNKAISVTNGNANAMYATGSQSSGSDLVLDQSVPTERLGNEFAMVRSLSPLTNSYDMEGGIVIATENNTEVYLNDILIPVATLNEGEYYRILNSGYINQGNSHYNIYVHTSKNVYLYQLVGSSGGTATGGYNYIPPLNCFLPRKIDEIGKVSEMPGSSGTITLKLNILTEAGATVTYTVNGGAPITPTAAQGPYTLTGNSNWVTYAITGVTGNLAIQSNKAVTAGINGGYSTAGYGGYFAGFSSIPLISKTTGDCIPGIVLEVDDSYDTYQWYFNGNPIPGANSNSYTPTQGGDYTVKVTIGSCPPETTPVFKVFTCLTNSTKAINVCDISQLIVPEFTVSTQTYNPGSVTIVTQPTNGMATVNPVTGVINYTPNVGYVGTDTIVYKFCGTAPEFVDCEQVTLTVTVSELPVVTDATLRTCFLESNTATGEFNLTTAPVTTQAGVTKNYYPSLTDAQNGTNEILNPDQYIAPNGVAFVRVTNGNGCFRIAKVTLIVFPPTKSTVLTDKIICMEDKTTLDAGPAFDGYQWSTGATTQTISDVTVGTYWVKLKTGLCWTTQTVKVYASEQPVISSVDIATNTVTVYATGGTAPYKYSMDNISWQDSNVFTNVPRGSGMVYVKDGYDCNPISVEITIPNLINVITPNNDGVNDVLDYSELGNKSNLVIDIFDRYGTKIYQANKTNGYKWDGSTNGSKKVSTGSYWFSVSWNEPNSKQTPVKYSGWILVKNRE
ncbi:gliding motility-associated C-terminal domain-containing protein [Chryseobacterium sp. RG1]|uniref:Gliding motility-associated C-terminal domain-containing protein n=1 Tax=Chryseobacterium tagetis TaxID=2801334 RepID=A0ABS8A8J4_9FLAO|nr:gliding motility-associated C-terminal domain-containing protein [Chryseobacterium tagetis]MCA6069270.1 gliding motility-associated C-terminal domain-containing protein [Chryseobacterium tagetis]